MWLFGELGLCAIIGAVAVLPVRSGPVSTAAVKQSHWHTHGAACTDAAGP